MADFGKLDFSVSFRPQSAFPLDARSYFESYDSALEKAATAQLAGGTDSRYYVGQVLAVCDTATSATTYYKINQDRKLTKIIDADFLSGYVTNGKNYKVQLAETGAYVNVPWESGGSGGTTVEVDDVTIKKNTSNQIYVAGVPLSVRSAISASSSQFGTVKLGFEAPSGKNRQYAISADSNGKAFVEVPWTDTTTAETAIDGTTIKKNTADGDKLYVDVTALSNGLTGTFQAKGTYLTAVPSEYKTYDATLTSLSSDYILKSQLTGYTPSGKNYKVQTDANGFAYVNVPWESGSNVDVDNDTLSTNASGKLYVRQILSSQVSGLGSFATKSSLLSTDIPALNSTKISDLGDLATKDESDLDFASKATTLAGYGITDAKIENGVSITLGDTTISVLTAHQQVSDISASMAAALNVPLTGYVDSTFETYPMQTDENSRAFVSVDVSYRPRDCEVSLTGSITVEISVYNRSLHYVELDNTSPQQNLVIYPDAEFHAYDRPFDTILILKPAFPLTSVRVGNRNGDPPNLISPDPEATTRTLPNDVPTCISLTKFSAGYILNRSLMYEFSQI